MKRYNSTLRLADEPAKVIEFASKVNGYSSVTAQFKAILEDWGKKHKHILKEYNLTT